MVNGYSLDPHPNANFATEEFAIIRLKSRKRDRIPGTNVTVVASMEEALEGADSAQDLYAAKVAGPARSSEGYLLYYIIKIL